MFTLDFNAIAEQLRNNKSAIVNNALAPAVVEELKARHGMDVYGGAINHFRLVTNHVYYSLRLSLHNPCKLRRSDIKK